MKFKHAGHDVGDDLPPLIVGVINLSPESFYKNSVTTDDKELALLIEEMSTYGAHCIDVGAMSTRPIALYGGQRSSIREEKNRISKFLPSIIEISSSYDLPVALDTQHSQIAEEGIKLGCEVINDISGLNTDPQLAEIVAAAGLDLVVMATKNDPGDVCGINETLERLEISITLAKRAGISPTNIAIDPAFGGWAGRDTQCDLEILTNFHVLKKLNQPIYVGVSRKSTIGTLNGGDTPSDRLVGSIVLTNWLVDQGANIIRTHDVKHTVLGLNVKNSLDSI